MNEHLSKDYYKNDVDSRYRLIHVLAQRARALQEGCEPLIPEDGYKPSGVALREFLAGKLKWEVPMSDDEVSLEMASKAELHEKVDEALSAPEEEAPKL